ncbi:ester cyclase [Streptomyces klenkii]|uniref:ester cyclase n=1 Tax=Streptomyces klenkii TaxID=1420899 RepID=UPI0033A078C5
MPHQTVAHAFAAFPDTRVILEDALVSGDRAAGKFTYCATHLGSLLGEQHTGHEVEMRSLDIWRVAGWTGLVTDGPLRAAARAFPVPAAPGPGTCRGPGHHLRRCPRPGPHRRPERGEHEAAGRSDRLLRRSPAASPTSQGNTPVSPLIPADPMAFDVIQPSLRLHCFA